MQWILGTLSLVVKHLESEIDHTPSSSAQIKNDGAVLPSLHYIFMVYCLIKHGTTLPLRSVCTEYPVYEPSGALAALQSAYEVCPIHLSVYLHERT